MSGVLPCIPGLLPATSFQDCRLDHMALPSLWHLGQKPKIIIVAAVCPCLRFGILDPNRKWLLMRPCANTWLQAKMTSMRTEWLQTTWHKMIAGKDDFGANKVIAAWTRWLQYEQNDCSANRMIASQDDCKANRMIAVRTEWLQCEQNDCKPGWLQCTQNDCRTHKAEWLQSCQQTNLSANSKRC